MHESGSEQRGLTRRRLLQHATAACGLLLPGVVLAADAESLIQAIIGERKVETGALKLTTPPIAENGNTVPISVEIDGRFSADSYVKAIHVFAMENPTPEVISFEFTPRSGRAKTATRIRLAKTQQVVAIAEWSDGRVWRTANEVKVTIGGCGG